ncbi:MAG: xanthine dehydrogenase family protein molybdopterin-binding subunit [Hyphomicrobiaceae bacterium]
MDGATAKWSGRIEDDALLRGQGRYGDDVKPQGTAAGVFVRSSHAHARINGIDTTEAAGMPGVLAVLTAGTLEGAGLNSVTGAVPIPGWTGSKPAQPFRPALAGDRVVHVGQPVALVIAETDIQAQDAAEKVAVDYDPLEAIIDAERAAAAGSPQLWPQAPGNLALDWSAPNDPDGTRRKAVEDLFAKADHVTRIKLTNQRVAAVSMEPRVATASYDPASDRFTLRAGTQGVAGILMQTAMAMKLPAGKLRVLTDDVGGGFGMKASGYPEYVALLMASKEVGRPVHWSSTRSEAFVSDNQARDQIFDAELALDKDGRILAMRMKVLANLGAFLTGVALYCNTVHLTGCLPSVYDIPHIFVESKGIFTNEVPIGPYRGAGRPEINYLVERLVDKAAREMKIDPAELRRRNLIKPSQMPYTTFVGGSFDSGDFPGAFEKAIEAADYAGFAKRRAESEARGKRRGLGLGCFLEISGGHLDESAAIKFPGGGIIHASIGASPQGQGHRTVFAKLVADRLGLPASAVEIQCGDSDRDVPGMGAVASRSAMLVGSALADTAKMVVEKGRAAAAVLLQASPDDVEYANGAYQVAGSNSKVSLLEVAERAKELVSQGAIKETLDTKGDTHTGPSFPNGCHVVEVEVDPDTGGVKIVRYTAVGDCGNILDTVILEGQVHGGVAQGLGQALLEQMVYDTDSGQLLTGSLMDYGLLRAEDMPNVNVLHHGVACTTNTVGAKGVGESGTTAAPSALVNAVIDALPPGAEATGVEMPLTPEKVWAAFQHNR